MARPRLLADDLGGEGIEDLGGGGSLAPGDGPLDPGPGYEGPLAEEGPIVDIPEGFDPNTGRGSEGPRERTGPGGVRRRPPPTVVDDSPGRGSAPPRERPRPTPPTPPEPTPEPGTPSPAPSPEAPPAPPIPGGPIPSPPMPAPGGGQVPGTARLRGQRLMGMGGGLTGGGLGTPFDPVADETSFDIDTLIKMLGGQ